MLTVYTAASANRVLLRVRQAPQIWANCMLRGALPSSILLLEKRVQRLESSSSTQTRIPDGHLHTVAYTTCRIDTINP